MEAGEFIGKTVFIHEGGHLMATGSITGINGLCMVAPEEKLPHYDIEIRGEVRVEGDIICNLLHCMGMATACI